MSKKSKAVQSTETAQKEKGVSFGKLMAWSLRPGSTGVCMMILGYLTIFATDTLKMDPKLAV